MTTSKLSKAMMMTSLAVAAVAFVGCKSMNNSSPSNTAPTAFGKTPDGKSVELYTLRNSKGMEARIMTYGGIVTSLKVADKTGQFSDVVLGYDHLDGYVENNPYFGALIGRYGNRIAQGKFTLNGRQYTLAQNNGENSLHGGVKSFDKVVWKTGKVTDRTLELHYFSKNGEEGFPGNLNVKAVYEITEDNALRLDFTATTDAATPCNLTHHSYFNLAGKGDVLNHVVTINADKFTPTDAGSIPTGELRRVRGTPFDFTIPTTIGARINNDYDQLTLGKGYDHNWVINQTSPGVLTKAATVSEASSGRVMEVWSTEPGTQFYTGNFLDGTITGKGGWVYQQRHGFCFEPQHFPDSPNKPNFPSCILNPGETYQNTIIYKFSIR